MARQFTARKKCEKALAYGAVEILMVSDEKLMKTRMVEEEKAEKEAEEIDRMLEETERQRGEVVIFSTEFEPGKRLNAWRYLIFKN